MKFEQLATNKVMIFDGAIGTMLMAAGMRDNECPEQFMLREPEVMYRIHLEYVKSGAQIITTNTFGASEVNLKRFGLGDEVENICQLAVKMAKKASRDKAFVAGSIGPLGIFLPPFGELDPKLAFKAFQDQARALENAGADLIIIETMTDLREAQIALRAVKSAVSIPIIAHLAFNDEHGTVTGTPPQVEAITLGAMKPFAIGTNCGENPRDMISHIQRMRPLWNGPISAEPNAGIPVKKDDELVWPADPKEMAEIALELYRAGANLIGLCCGSTPEHTTAIARALNGKGPLHFDFNKNLFLASRSQWIEIDSESPLKVVGERINPAGRKKLAREMAVLKMSTVRREAFQQAKFGAKIIDVNASVPGADEAAIMSAAIRAVGATSDLPLFIDSSSLEAIQSGLAETVGKAVINSVTASEKDMREKLPLAAEYGAAIVALPLDEKGIPDVPSERLELVDKIARNATEYGIAREDILADPIVMSQASNAKNARTTVETARLLKKSGYYTVCGLSNISHGLPGRNKLNAAFLALIAPWLDLVIANPMESELMDSLVGSNLLLEKDLNAESYVERFRDTPELPSEPDEKLELKREIISGNPETSAKLAEQALEKSEPLDIVERDIIPALNKVGKGFARKEIFLPQVIASAVAAKSALKVLEKAMKGDKIKRKKIVIATVAGDIHDIGKNLVGSVLQAHGYEVIDLGKSVPNEKIITAIEKNSPDGVGLSALMTTTMPSMQGVVMAIKAKWPRIPIVIGGACVNLDFARQIGADSYAKDALEAVDKFNELVKGKK